MTDIRNEVRELLDEHYDAVHPMSDGDLDVLFRQFAARGLTVVREGELEQRIDMAASVARSKAEADFANLLGRVVAAAGGTVAVPDSLMVEDMSVASDYENFTTVYHARLSRQPEGQ